MEPVVAALVHYGSLCYSFLRLSRLSLRLLLARRGKSGLRWALHGVTPLHRKVRNSGTERMSRAMILDPGTGRFRGAAGVKTAKLCREQDQIGKQFSNFGWKKSVARTWLPGQIA